MKQTAHIAKTRGYVLAELLYIQSSVSRQRPFVIFVNDFACHFIYLETMNNEMFQITQLSADELSCLNCLLAKSLTFDFSCHQILRSHALKMKISKKSSMSRNKRLQMSATCIASCRQPVVASLL